MLRTKPTLITAAFVALAATACKPKDSDADGHDAKPSHSTTADANGELVAKPALSGNWRSKCHADVNDETGEATGHAVGSSYYEGAKFEVSMADYASDDPSCETLNAVYVVRGTFTIGQRVASVDAFEIDFDVDSFHMTPKTEDVAESFNASRLCGFDTWEADAPKNVTETACNKLRDGQFDLFALRDGKLYFGKLTRERDGTSAKKRPDSLELEVPFERSTRD